MAGSPRFGSISPATLEAVSKGAESRMKFTATKRVDSEAIALDRRLCLPGDEIQVVRWHCFKGPTEIVVKSRELRGGKHCIPFGWVMEMGAPADLAAYMPFAPQTWEEVLAEANARSDAPGANE